jgi:hypothetical protein
MRITFTVLATLSLSIPLIAANPLVGTWKLNVAKSKLQCSDIASETMKITETGSNSFRNTYDVVSKSGADQHSESPNRIFDGKEYPVPGHAGFSETVQRIDASTFTVTFKKDGKVAGNLTVVVASDGKVHTVHRVAGTCDEMLVFERQ